MKVLSLNLRIFLAVLAAALFMAPLATAAMNQDEFVDLCLQGTPEEVEAALKAGADPNASAGDGHTPLSMAARDFRLSGGFKKAEILIKAGADPKALAPGDENVAPIHVASGAGNAELVSRLIGLGVDINSATDDGHTPLMHACMNSTGSPIKKAQMKAVVKALLDAGADPKAGTDRNVTALMYAAKGDSTELVGLLLAAGADVNATVKSGDTPLIAAAFSSSDPEMVRLLLAAGADVNAAKGDETPLSNARRNRSQAAGDIIKMLQEAGAK